MLLGRRLTRVPMSAANKRTGAPPAYAPKKARVEEEEEAMDEIPDDLIDDDQEMMMMEQVGRRRRARPSAALQPHSPRADRRPRPRARE